MTDIKHIADILREFAKHKIEKSDRLIARAHEKQFRYHDNDERARLLQHQAMDLIGYADEIETWWANK